MANQSKNFSIILTVKHTPIFPYNFPLYNPKIRFASLNIICETNARPSEFKALLKFFISSKITSCRSVNKDREEKNLFVKNYYPTMDCLVEKK